MFVAKWKSDASCIIQMKTKKDEDKKKKTNGVEIIFNI